uniref:rRNA N-glycosidase n=1 Tax=Aegilops tauschii TaxID=37682 RepID=M8BV38_AEGTA
MDPAARGVDLVQYGIGAGYQRISCRRRESSSWLSRLSFSDHMFLAMLERRPQLWKQKHRGKAFMALIFFPVVVLLSGSSRTMSGLSTSALIPPVERNLPVRHRPIIVQRSDKLFQRINPMDTEELAMGRNDTAQWSKSRVQIVADVVRSDVDRGDKKVQMKNILESKPMASQFRSSATKQGIPKFASLTTPGSMDRNNSGPIAGILRHMMGQNATYAVLIHTEYFEFIPLEEFNSGSSDYVNYSETEPNVLIEVLITTFAAGIIVWLISTTMNIKPVISRCLGKDVRILIAVAVVLASSTHVRSAPEDIPPVVATVFGEGVDSYNPFLNVMHTLLEANTEPDEYDKYFLPQEKQPGPPAWWISVEVKEDMFPQGCTPLGFTSKYHDLTGREDRKVDLSLFLQKVLLGRTAAKYAADILVEYGVTIKEPELAKRALLVYTLMIPEALRFKPIRNQIKLSWLHPVTLTPEQSNMVFGWQDMSILFCRGDDTSEENPKWTRGDERLKKADIKNRQDLINTLDFVKYEKQCKKFRKEKKKIP